MSEELFSPEFEGDALLVAVARGDTTLSQGAKGDSVLAVQKALVELGVTIRPDGSFGPKTRAALCEWQRSVGLPETEIVDAATMSAIDRILVETRKSNLLDAISRAAGANPSRPGARPLPAPRASDAADVNYFVDADALVGVGHAPAEDPDSPPPDVDRAAPAPSRGAPLPLDRQTMFQRIVHAMGDDAAARSALDRILAAGRFHHAGKLLPNLLDLATTNRHPELMLEGGIDANLILRQVVRHVDNPLRVQQGYGRGTCGAGVIEYLLLRRNASEFVRLANGITGFSGQTTLQSGRTITMPRTAIPRDDTGRIDIDRLFQSTIMNHATLMSWLFDYDNPKDDGSFWASAQGNSQMPIWGFIRMVEDILGETRTSISTMSQSQAEIAQIVVTEAGSGDRVPVIMQFSTYHWLSVERVERGSDEQVTAIVLRNPWGYDEAQGKPPREPLPEGGGRIRMKFGDFTDAIMGAVVRAQ